MFAKSVIGSARFLRMPATSRLLYYDMGMDADDDGVVEAFSVMRKTGATEDDLRVLASKGFVRVMNEDLVSYILDWNTNNQIRKDRYHESVYKSLIDGSCNVILESGNQMATKSIFGTCPNRNKSNSCGGVYMNKKTTLPPDGAKGIETIEDILAMSEDEKRELLRLRKERKAREAKPGRGGKRQTSGKFESA